MDFGAFCQYKEGSTETFVSQAVVCPRLQSETRNFQLRFTTFILLKRFLSVTPTDPAEQVMPDVPPDGNIQRVSTYVRSRQDVLLIGTVIEFYR